jgi:integrase
VQEALGHASVATTQRYTATSRAEVRSVAEAEGGHALLRGRPEEISTEPMIVTRI